jgi:hypothetical protein
MSQNPHYRPQTTSPSAVNGQGMHRASATGNLSIESVQLRRNEFERRGGAHADQVHSITLSEITGAEIWLGNSKVNLQFHSRI